MYADEEYSKVLLSGLNELRKRGLLCDVELHVSDFIFRAHKAVLSACSKYFKAMFTGKMEESNQEKVELHEIDPDSVKDIINFAYTGNVCITQGNVQDLLTTARMLHLERIVDACCEFMISQMHPSNCIGILALADLHSCHKLWTQAFQYIEDHFTEVILFEEFLKVDFSLLSDILESDNLNVSSEVDVVNALEMWALYDPNKRSVLIPELTREGLRMFHLDTSYLSSYTVDGALSSFSAQCKNIFAETLVLKTNPDRATDNRLQAVAAARRESNHIIVIGGKTGLFDVLDCCESYHWMDCWHVTGKMNEKRTSTSAAALNGQIYLIGGLVENNDHRGRGENCDGKVQYYNPLKDTWNAVASLNEPRYNHETVTLDSVLYVLGGYNGQNCLRSVECYTEYTRQWKSLKPMQYSRSCFAVAALDGFIYVLGGYGRAHLSSVEKYDPKLDKWSMVPAMGTARNNFGACSLHGFIYAVGGHDGVRYLSSIERFDPSTSEWTIVAIMDSPRTGLGVSVMGKKIFVIGGHDGTKYLSTVQCYDPNQDTWSYVAKMNNARCYMATVPLWIR